MFSYFLSLLYINLLMEFCYFHPFVTYSLPLALIEVIKLTSGCAVHLANSRPDIAWPSPVEHCIYLVTQEREHYFACSDAGSALGWAHVLGRAISGGLSTSFTTPDVVR